MELRRNLRTQTDRMVVLFFTSDNEVVVVVACLLGWLAG